FRFSSELHYVSNPARSVRNRHGRRVGRRRVARYGESSATIARRVVWVVAGRLCRRLLARSRLLLLPLSLFPASPATHRRTLCVATALLHRRHSRSACHLYSFRREGIGSLGEDEARDLG